MKSRTIMMECKHKWKKLEEHEGTRRTFFGAWLREKVFILECSVCGDIKQRWVSLPYIKSA